MISHIKSNKKAQQVLSLTGATSLTGENLGYKPGVVQKAKFEYCPFDQVLNKRLEKDEKQVGLLKGLKNIKGKTDNQLNKNKDSQLGIKFIGYTVKEELSQ